MGYDVDIIIITTMGVLLTLSSGKPWTNLPRYDNGAFLCLFLEIGPLQATSNMVGK